MLRFLRMTVAIPRACLRISVKSDADCGPGSFYWHFRNQMFKRWKRRGLPSSRGALLCPRPALSPRRDPPASAAIRQTGMAPRTFNRGGSLHPTTVLRRAGLRPEVRLHVDGRTGLASRHPTAEEKLWHPKRRGRPVRCSHPERRHDLPPTAPQPPGLPLRLLSSTASHKQVPSLD